MLVGLRIGRLAFQTLINEKGQMCSKHRQEWCEWGFQQTDEINWDLAVQGMLCGPAVGKVCGSFRISLAASPHTCWIKVWSAKADVM